MAKVKFLFSKYFSSHFYSLKYSELTYLEKEDVYLIELIYINNYLV